MSPSQSPLITGMRDIRARVSAFFELAEAVEAASIAFRAADGDPAANGVGFQLVFPSDTNRPPIPLPAPSSDVRRAMLGDTLNSLTMTMFEQIDRISELIGPLQVQCDNKRAAYAQLNQQAAAAAGT